MSSVDHTAAAAAKFDERVNRRLAGLKSEGLVIHATAPYGSGPDNAHGIYVIVTDDSAPAQSRIRACLGNLGRLITIAKRSATFEAQEAEDIGDD